MSGTVGSSSPVNEELPVAINTQVAQAVSSRELDTLRLLSEHHPDALRETLTQLNPDYGGASILHLEAQRGHHETLKVVLPHLNQSDINTVASDGATPLLAALCRCGPNADDIHETIRLLVAHDANVNCTDQDGLTPLHEAANNGDVTSVEILLNAGANCNVQSDVGSTPLHMAAIGSLGRVDCYKVLGVDRSVNAQEVKEKFHQLALTHHPDKVKPDAASKQEVESRFAQICVAYQILSSQENRETYDNAFIKVAKMLLKHGANPSLTTIGKVPRTAELLAIDAQQWDVAICIAEASGVGDATDKHGRTMLHHIVAKFEPTMWIRTILNSKLLCCQLEMPDAVGLTPFLTACSFGNSEAVKVMLECKERVKKLLEQVSDFGETGLVAAVKGGHTEIVKALLDTGIEFDIARKDNADQTASDYAEMYEYDEIRKLLSASQGL